MAKENKRIIKKPEAEEQAIAAKQSLFFKEKSNFIILAAILLLTVIVFGTLVNNGFFWDDVDYIQNNPFITNLSIQEICTIFSSFYCANYHPLTTLSWAVEYHLWGLNPAGYHITNLIIHLCNIVLVFYFVRLFLKDIRIAVFTAVVFAIHPLHVESVAWISERKDVLYTLFYMLGLCLYMQYLNKKDNRLLVYTFAAFMLSCLSKSAAITLPLILMLIDYYTNNLSLKTIMQKIPFLIVSLIFGIVAITSQKAGNAVNQDIASYGLIDRIFFLSYSLYYYLVSFIIPTPLCSLHYYPKAGTTLPLVYYFSALIIVLLSLAIVFIKKYRKELIFGFGFYLISISLVLQFIPLGKSIVSERYSYVPYIGLALMVAKITLDAIATISQRKQVLIVVYVCVATGVIGFSLESYDRSCMWKDAYTLFTDVIEQNPNESFSYGLRCNDRIQANDYVGCIADCNKGIALDSNSMLLYANRAIARFNCADYNGSIADYNKVIATDSTNSLVYYNRAKSENAMHDYISAIRDYEKAVSMQRITQENLLMYLDMAHAKLAVNDAIGAIADIDKVLAIDSQVMLAYFSKGNCYLKLQQYQLAIQNFTLALQYDANFDKAICNRGVAKLYTGDAAGACADFKRAGDMGNMEARNNFMAKCR